jgi:hypothetical protein
MPKARYRENRKHYTDDPRYLSAEQREQLLEDAGNDEVIDKLSDHAEYLEATLKAVRKCEIDWKQALTNFAKLPEMCVARLPSDKGQLILIRRGEMGYTPLDSSTAGALEHYINNGVRAAQIQAMLAGSMMGWDLGAADPDLYDSGADKEAA